VILPERTGPIADVLYSAAGNSADEHWYNRDVIAYSFETGADRYVNTTLSVASAAGDIGIRAANRNAFGVGDTIKVDFGTPNEEVRKIVAIAQPNTPSPQPNITLDAPLTLPHAVGAVLGGGTLQQGSASSLRTTPRASSRRSSSPRGTTGSSSRPTSTRRTGNRPGSG
jgi:hypothetical protein